MSRTGAGEEPLAPSAPGAISGAVHGRVPLLADGDVFRRLTIFIQSWCLISAAAIDRPKRGSAGKPS
jgi:hypothetical protein